VPLLNWDTGQQDYGFGAEFDEEEYGVGAEWSYVHSLFFRFGYKSAQAGDIQDTTWGFGFYLARWVGKGITFDYASVPQATGLDRVNRLSLGFRFYPRDGQAGRRPPETATARQQRGTTGERNLATRGSGPVRSADHGTGDRGPDGCAASRRAARHGHAANAGQGPLPAAEGT
jgi:hypothetical protein